MIDRRTIFPSIVDSRSRHLSSSKKRTRPRFELPSPPIVFTDRGPRFSKRRLKDWDAYTHISTRSTLTPQGSVASSREVCMVWEMVSRSERISAKFLVPSTVRNVLAASSRVEWLEISRQFRFYPITTKFHVSTSVHDFFYLARSVHRASEIVFLFFFFSPFSIGSAGGNERSNVLTS